ncbi:hypothetical protein CRG98_022710 [Punica granatum]|uniref:Uncharacterized protein n=1 Tax=Punica granatum TaxID=22663 RepID=A0A2I0JKT0_PUNGR|nr:hypothetical protein CRG98_022710 [Punica granatum]
MNIDPEVILMVELGLKYELVTVYTKADRMEDSDDEGHEDFDIETHGIMNDTDEDAMEAREAGDGVEDETDDDVWELEDGEKDETEKDESNIGGYEGVSDRDNKLIRVREKRKAFKMQTDKRKKRHARRRKKKQARQSNDVNDDVHIPKIPIGHSGKQSSMEKGNKKYRPFIPNCDISNITLNEDMIFSNNEQFKEAVKSYAIVNGFEL